MTKEERLEQLIAEIQDKVNSGLWDIETVSGYRYTTTQGVRSLVFELELVER